MEAVRVMRALDELLSCKRVAGTRVNAELLRRRALIASAADHSRAVADLDAALRIDPDNLDCLTLRAKLYDECGDKERCFLDLRRVAVLAPKVMKALSLYFAISCHLTVLCVARPEAPQLRYELPPRMRWNRARLLDIHIIMLPRTANPPVQTGRCHVATRFWA